MEVSKYKEEYLKVPFPSLQVQEKPDEDRQAGAHGVWHTQPPLLSVISCDIVVCEKKLVCSCLCVRNIVAMEWKRLDQFKLVY